MTTRHRKATRPLTPLSSIAPSTRRGLVVAASSGLALTMIATGANATSGTEVAESAGSLDASLIAAEVRTAVTTNAAISVDAAAEEVTSDAAVEVETADEAAARVAAEEAEAAAAAAAQATATQEDAGAAASSGTQAASASPAVAVANPSGSSIVAIALQYQGVPYVSGGTTPAGWDCSGFVQYVYAQAGIALPRTSYAQGGAGTLVSAAEAQPGDIVYYGYHVGIYVGDGMMIDAGTPSTGTVYRPVWGSPTGYIRVG